MRFVQAIVFVCFMSQGAVMATGVAQSQPEPVAAPHAVASDQRKLDRSEAEVKRLQHDVQQQERDSQRAGERLQQQDQKIVELQRQLQALQPSQSGGPQ